VFFAVRAELAILPKSARKQFSSSLCVIPKQLDVFVDRFSWSAQKDAPQGVPIQNMTADQSALAELVDKTLVDKTMDRGAPKTLHPSLPHIITALTSGL